MTPSKTLLSLCLGQDSPRPHAAASPCAHEASPSSPRPAPVQSPSGEAPRCSGVPEAALLGAGFARLSQQLLLRRPLG